MCALFGLVRALFSAPCRVMTEPAHRSLLPLYFPRNKNEEAYAACNLPADTGSAETGEPVIEERKIRITDNPTLNTTGLEAVSCEDLETAGRAFTHMSADPDSARRTRGPGTAEPASDSCTIS